MSEALKRSIAKRIEQLDKLAKLQKTVDLQAMQKELQEGEDYLTALTGSPDRFRAQLEKRLERLRTEIKRHNPELVQKELSLLRQYFDLIKEHPDFARKRRRRRKNVGS